ncbi:MAG: tetraacyldisaccharide 4-kinase [Flavipsychrobacter sp.]|jgi:tetraacyldisaccharide 4'-kinase|nr:tetraacyldisaccharide 4-kinase [Flavipsychrobacter sp.]
MENKNLLYYIFSVVRLLLYPFALIYGALVWLRNRLYDVKFFNSVEFSVPVITIGNLSTGGTGKTPHVEYLVNLLQYRFRVATMSRGYKRHTQGFLLADENTNALRIGDEPMQYHMKFPELVVSVAEERMIGIPTLLQRRPDVEAILLDDAYQHRSVRAGLNILITDHAKPFYDDYILPFGNLRESRNAYKRADVIIVSKCPPLLTPEEAAAIEKKIAPLPHQQVFFTGIAYSNPIDLLTKEHVALGHKNIILVCGIARPEPLINYLKNTSADVHTLTYQDHHYFVTADLEEIKEAYDNWSVPDKIIVTTEKDAARLYLHADKLRAWGITIAVLPITVYVLFNKGKELDAIVTNYVEKTIAENNEVFGAPDPSLPL